MRTSKLVPYRFLSIPTEDSLEHSPLVRHMAGYINIGTLLFILLLAVTMFIVLPSVSWADETSTLFNNKCAVCHGSTGAADTPMAKKQVIPSFSSERVRKQSNAEIEDFILNGGKEKKSSHAWAHKGLSREDGVKLAAFVKKLGTTNR